MLIFSHQEQIWLVQGLFDHRIYRGWPIHISESIKFFPAVLVEFFELVLWKRMEEGSRGPSSSFVQCASVVPRNR